MIPKIAHFHWEGQPIGWLRMMGVYTFAILNPRWEVRLIRTPEHILAKDLPLYAHEADWAWAEALCEHGGFSWGTDTIFVKPVPDEWLDGEMCACTEANDGKALFHGSIGSVPHTVFLEAYVDRCRNRGRPNKTSADYQAYGTPMMNDVVAMLGGMVRLRERLKLVEMPADAMTPVRWVQPERLWAPEPLELPEATIAVTWYGQHESSRKHEPHAHLDSNHAITKLLRQVLKKHVEGYEDL